jgi:cobalt/nickel transport system permease protein
MHIADGILPAGACLAAHAVALAAVSWTGRKIEAGEVVRMGLLSSAIFVVSMFHFPVGGSSIHLGLTGLAGVLLGRRAMPVIYTTLLFQALLFQHGGLLSLGVNAVNMGLGTLAAAAIWKLRGLPEGARAFAAGLIGTLLPAALMAAEFYAADYGKGFAVIVTVYAGVAAIEGAVTSFIVEFVRRVKPAILIRAAA